MIQVIRIVQCTTLGRLPLAVVIADADATAAKCRDYIVSRGSVTVLNIWCEDVQVDVAQMVDCSASGSCSQTSFQQNLLSISTHIQKPSKSIFFYHMNFVANI